MEEGKKTKGKQKIEIKKIEDDKDLYSTFTKRKSGIHKKASELSTLCGAMVDIVMFSPCGKSFCYGKPSLQSMTRTSLDEGHPSEGGNVDQLVEDHKRLEINKLNEKNDALLDQLYVEKAREKQIEGILKTVNSNNWWEAKVQDLKDEEARAMESSLMELQSKLTNELSIKSGENASDGRDVSDSIIPPYKKAHEANLVLDDATTSLTNASGSGGHALTFSPPNQCQGDNPFLDNASNENTDGSGSHDLAFSPSNQH